MKTLYFTSALLLAVTAQAQTDSVRTEYATETSDQIPVDTVKRTWRERKLMQYLFLRSRPETTMFQVGIAYPFNYLPWGNRAVKDRYSYGGIWAGINHKLTPDLGVRGGVSWSPAQWSSNIDKSVKGANWVGQLAVDYYLNIRKDLREGRTSNNIYLNPCLTVELLRPLSTSTLTELKTGVNDTLVPFRQSLGIGLGQVGIRTRWFYGGVSTTVAYWFGKSSAVRHAVQPMINCSFGLAF